ncbi:hypothetical protein DPMN_174571 [Dreissena polymorpha]|uniref:Uncharacterized protein n=1 Tax=Dreissena polymorpha TaxID=45954 RepID=A0A9D4E3L5_DREPO|nr:hypothetical protein DPMN_174571 [Dreissena polymorpha]
MREQDDTTIRLQGKDLQIFTPPNAGTDGHRSIARSDAILTAQLRTVGYTFTGNDGTATGGRTWRCVAHWYQRCCLEVTFHRQAVPKIPLGRPVFIGCSDVFQQQSIIKKSDDIGFVKNKEKQEYPEDTPPALYSMVTIDQTHMLPGTGIETRLPKG